MADARVRPSISLPDDLAYRDDLTGLHNRRLLNLVLDERWVELKGLEGGCSLMIIDLDHFKAVNDTYGHLSGDAVLKETTSLLRKSFRGSDIITRFGGDEFVLVLPGTPKETARTISERVRKAMEERRFLTHDQKPMDVRVTFSIGVASFPEDGEKGSDIFEQADKAVYASKRAGRNRVTAAGEFEAAEDLVEDLLKGFPAKTLVGRDGPLGEAEAFVKEVAGGKAAWLLLRGPAGVGKTRLLREIQARAQKGNLRAAYVLAEESKASVPYQVLGLFLDAASARERGFLEELRDQAPEGIRAVLRVLVPSFPPPPEGASPPPPLPPEESGRLLLDFFRSALVRLSEGGACLLLLDDMQWADKESLDLLRFAQGELGMALGVGAALRAEAAGGPLSPAAALAASLEGSPGLHRMALAPLDGKGTAALVSELLPKRPESPAFDGCLYQVTQGNPLYIEESLKILIAKGMILRKRQGWAFQPVTPDDLPPTLEDAIRTRIHLLDPQVGKVVEQASVLGNQFDLEMLQAMLGMNQGEALDVVDRARAMGILETGDGDQVGSLRFRAPKVREIAYQDADAALRKEAHRKAGAEVERRLGGSASPVAASLAYHFGRAEEHQKAAYYERILQAIRPVIVIAGPGAAGPARPGAPGKPRAPRRPWRIKEADTALDREALVLVEEVARYLTAGVKNLFLYPKGSQITTDAVESLQRVLDRLFAKVEVVTFAEVDGQLVVNSVPFAAKRSSLVLLELVKILRDQGLRSLTLQRGLSKRETEFLLEALSKETEGKTEVDPDAWAAVFEKNRIDHADVGARVYVLEHEAAATGGGAVVPPGFEGSPVVQVGGTTTIDLDPVLLQKLIEAGNLPRVGGATAGPTEPPPREAVEGFLKHFREGGLNYADVFKKLPAVLEKALDAPKDDSFETLLRMLGDGASSAERAVRERAADALVLVQEKMSYIQREDQKAIAKETILRHLETSRDPAVLPKLVEMASKLLPTLLLDQDYFSARKVLAFFRRCRDTSAPKEAQELSRRATQKFVRSDAFEILLSDLRSDQALKTQRAFQTLSLLGEEGTGPVAVFVQETEDFRARKIAATALKEMSAAAAAGLTRHLSPMGNPAPARRIASLLETLSPDLEADLRRALESRVSEVRGEAVRILHRQAPEVRARVLLALVGHDSPEVARQAAYYLGEWGIAEGVPGLEEALGRPAEPAFLRECCVALGKLARDTSVPVLVGVLNARRRFRWRPLHPPEVRAAAARALRQIPSEAAQRAAGEAQSDRDAQVRAAAAEERERR